MFGSIIDIGGIPQGILGFRGPQHLGVPNRDAEDGPQCSLRIRWLPSCVRGVGQEAKPNSGWTVGGLTSLICLLCSLQVIREYRRSGSNRHGALAPPGGPTGKRLPQSGLGQERALRGYRRPTLIRRWPSDALLCASNYLSDRTLRSYLPYSLPRTSPRRTPR